MRSTRATDPGAHGRRSGRAAPLAPADRRAAIVAAAGPLLRHGGHDVTTSQIAQAAGIAEGTVFRAFPNKQAVIDAVVADACDQSGTVDRIRAIDPQLALTDRVRSCAAILADRLTTMIDLMIALRMHGPPAPAAPHGGPGSGVDATGARTRHRRHREQQGELLDAVAELFDPDADRLSCSPRHAAHLLRLLTFSGTHRMINDGDALTAEEITDVLLHGIIQPDGILPDTPGRRARPSLAEQAQPPPTRSTP